MKNRRDTYRTLAKPSTGKYMEKGSRFLAYAFPVSSEYEARNRLLEVKKEHPTARHHCYAFSIGSDNPMQRTHDAGEPSGTAGKPIMGQIISEELTDVIIIVVRYFGGTLLGTSGLIRAYRAAAADALDNSEKEIHDIHEFYQISFAYEKLSEVMKIIKDIGIAIRKQETDNTCFYQLGIPRKSKERAMLTLNKIAILKSDESDLY